MTHDKENEEEKQSPSPLDMAGSSPLKDAETAGSSQVVFKTVPVSAGEVPQELVPEEVASTADSPQHVSALPLNPGVSPLPPQSYAHHEPNSMRKFLLIGLGGLAFLVMFFFIFRAILGAVAPPKQVSLTYWGLWEDQAVVQPLIKEYEAQHENVKITYQKMSPENYREKIVARSPNSKGPDIFKFHNTWLPEIREVVAPIPSNIMSSGEFEKTFYPVQTKDLKVDKFHYGIPLSLDGLVLLYNKDLFNKVGIERPPVSWEDVIDYASRLTVKDQEGKIITSGIALGTATNVDHFSDIFALFLTQNGGDIKNLTSPESVGALESYRKFAEAPDNFWDETMPASVLAFSQEKVAMIIVPSWQILTIKATNPELKVGVGTIPAIPGASPVSIATYWVEGVSKYSQNQKEAWAFLKFLSERDQMAKLYELQAKTRLFGNPYSRVDLGSTLSQNEYIGPVIKQANSYVSVPLIWRTYDNGLNDEAIVYIENAINATAEGVSYEEALTTAKEGMTQIFQKYGL